LPRFAQENRDHRGVIPTPASGMTLALVANVKSSIRLGSWAAFAGGVAFAGCFLNAAPAHAKTAIAADLDYAAPIDSDLKSGAGFAIRVGQQLHAPLVVLTPELVFSDHTFADDGPTAYRGLAGLRLGFGEIIRPGVYGHLGFGSLSMPDPVPSHTAFTYDAGIFLDLTILPLLDIGVHGAYNRLNAGDGVSAFEWGTIGAHAALVF
jgi:hypothetical protein